MKSHLRIDVPDEDALIGSYVRAAMEHIDGYSGILGRCLLSQEWELDLAGWPPCALRLPFPNVSELTVTYRDGEDQQQTLEAGSFDLIERPLGTEVHFTTSFSQPALHSESLAPVTLRMTAGYGDAAAVPHPIKVAIMMLAAHWYENREATGRVGELPFGVNCLLAPYRVVRV